MPKLMEAVVTGVIGHELVSKGFGGFEDGDDLALTHQGERFMRVPSGCAEVAAIRALCEQHLNLHHSAGISIEMVNKGN